MAGAAVAQLIGPAIMGNPHITEPATFFRLQAGYRNEYGEWVPGAFTQVEVRVVTTPLTGEERMLLPENIREEETRRFFMTATVDAVRNMAEGDAILHNQRAYRVVDVNEWGGFKDATVVFPFSGDLGEAVTTAAFTEGFSLGFES